jgi:hypothetical protein
VLVGGAAVVLATAGLLSNHAATRPDLPSTRWHRDLPGGVTAVFDGPAGRRSIRLGVLLGVVAGIAALATASAPVDGAVGVAVLVAVALLCGPLAPVANPVRLPCPEPTDDGDTTAVGMPAVVALAVLSLVVLTTHDGRLLAAVVAGHVLLQGVLCRRRGAGWPARGDPVETLMTTVGLLAPLGRRADGVLAWRNPVVSAAHGTLPQAALWQTAVVMGLTVASALPTPAVPTFLAAAVAAAGVLRAGFIRAWFIGAVAPLAAAYGLLAAGRWLPPLDLVVFVALHAVAMAVLHRQAIARHDPRTARAVQFLARTAILVSVLVGLAVLVSS